MVLGTMALGKSLYGNDTETACYPIEGADLAEQLAGAVAHIAPPDQALLDMDAPEPEDGKAELVQCFHQEIIVYLEIVPVITAVMHFV